MDYLELTFNWIGEVLVEMCIALLQQNFYLEYLLNKNLIDISRLIFQKYKMK